MHSGKSDPRRHAFERSNGGFKGWPENPQCAVWPPFDETEIRSEMFHLESIARIDVRKFRRSDIVFADDAGNSRERELQLFRFRRQRYKQSVLNHARFRRNGFEPNFANCGARRPRFKRQHEEARDDARVSRRHREAQRNNERLVRAFALQF